MLFTVPAFLKADEADSLAKLKMERAALEKRLTEVNTQIDKIQVGRGVNWFGVMLVDPTEDLMKQYGLPAEFLGPIVVQTQDRSFFSNGFAPTLGCAFWIVQHPARGFFFEDKSPSYHPKTVRELAEAVLACTVTPEEYQTIWDQSKSAARERAETAKDKPAERERWLKIADAKMPQDDVGKFICRVVYHYPERKGTMTTYIRMTDADLDKLREFLKK